MRFDHQRARNLDASPFASREHIAFAASHLLQAELLHQPRHALAPFAGVQRQRFENRHQVVFHRQLAEYRRLLRKIADAVPRTLIHRQRCNLFVVEQNAARIWRHESDDHIERCRLARTVRSQQTDHFSCGDRDRDVVHYLAPVVRLGNLESLQGWHSASILAIS